VPFTGSHPAAVLPLARTALPASALVIGSMAPDLPFYVPVPVQPEATHSLLGAVSIDVLLGGVAFAWWQAVLGPAVVAHLPSAFRRRLVRPVPAGLGYHLRAVRPILLVAAALMLGAVTHVGWDSFTHAGMWGPGHIRWLAEAHGPLPGYEWSQHASGLLGALVIGWWSVRWWRSHPERDVPGVAAAATGRRGPVGWTLVVVSMVAGTGYGLLVGLGKEDPVRSALFFGATYGMAAAGAVATTLAAVWTLYRSAAGRRSRAGRQADADQVGTAR
jgi:hypothetical protein